MNILGEKTFPYLPLLQGKQFHLLSPGQLRDLIAKCIYCGQKNTDRQARNEHLKFEHGEEHGRSLIVTL